MKRKIIITLFILAALTLGAYGFYTAGKQRGMTTTAPPMNGSSQNPAAADKKVLYWHDPMVPGQKFEKPGKSPFMDMQLVPVYAEEGDAKGGITINPRVQQNLGIRTAPVTVGNLTTSVETVGTVAYDDRDVALVQARSNGYVERLYVRAPLDPVKKGQTLLLMHVPEWIGLQEEYFTVKRMQDSGLQEGAKQRMRLAGMSDAQIKLIEKSGQVQPRITITAPISGVVSELAVREGMTVASGAPLFRLNGVGNIWINADILESSAAAVRLGDRVTARTPTLAGSVFEGKVNAILPEVNPTTRTVKARIAIANPGGRLVPGMFMNVSFAPNSTKPVLLIPTEAVIQTGTRTVVMVAEKEGQFAAVDVEIGAESQGQSEIRKGLTAGQKVVVSGQFLVDSEASLKGVNVKSNEVSAKPQNIHQGSGKIEKLTKEDVTLSHGPIASLNWGPMTMGFKLSTTASAKNLAIGDDVTFTTRQLDDGGYEITTITKADRSSTDAATKGPGSPAKQAAPQ